MIAEFDLRAIWQRIVLGWRTPLVIAGFAALLALATLPGSKPVYSVHMLILPAPSEQASSSGGGSTFSLLLGLAGGSGQTSNYVRYQNLLYSNAVAQRMQARHGMLEFVFRSIWDEKNHRWIQTSTLRDQLTTPLLRLANMPTWYPPDATTLAAFLKRKLVVMPSTGTDIIDISMEDPDVAYATRIMLAANEEANAILRDQVAKRAAQQVAYLQRELAKTTVEDYRQTLLALLSSEEKTLMLTQTDASYAAEIVSPPMASPVPVAPRPVLTLFVFLLVGGIIGTGIVVFFGPDWWQSVKGWISGPFARRRDKVLASRLTE